MHRTFRIAVAKSGILATTSNIVAALSVAALLVVAALLFAALPASASARVEVVPSTFDFGWAPDNAKITSDFIIRNTGSEVVPLAKILPSCGCTAANFTPGEIGSNEEKKFSLVFNTRGFVNQAFNKSSRITTDDPKSTYVAVQKGHITNLKALLFPEGDGVAGFPANAPSRKKAFSIVNKTGKDVTLAMVQVPAPWVSVELPSGPIRKGEKGTIEVTVSGALTDMRDTSFTVAPSDDMSGNRFTIAVYTSQGNSPYKINPAPNANPKPKPKAAETAPKAPTKKVPPVPAQKVPPKAKAAPAPQN